MTSSQIDKLEAGRELDALVAEHVMGWRITYADRSYDGDGGWSQHSWYSSSAQCRYKAIAYYREPDGVTLWEVDDFTPSTSIEAAWLVVEKLDTHVILERMDRVLIKDWYCEIRGISNGEGVSLHSAKAPTAPHAICLAALKVVSKS